jgi:hypothetical protein
MLQTPTTTDLSEQQQRIEWLKCSKSAAYFADTYCQIYDATASRWIPFKLWKEQRATLRTLTTEHLVVILKARQLGLTWLCLSFGLWLMLFHPVKTILLFSRRENEAKYLLSRLTGMYDKLPGYLKAKRVVRDNALEWALSNGSVAYGFPTTAGDSYTASFALVDEADLVPDLDRLMNAVKPTIDGGGWMILLSRADKDFPNSTFKRIYRAAKAGRSPWKSIFLPWFVRPSRDLEWYQSQKDDILSRTTTLDDLYQQYPSTDTEALAAKTEDRRLPLEWVLQCFSPLVSTEFKEAPGINELVVYKPPLYGAAYVIGADPAEGNPTSDFSSATVVNAFTLEEVAKLKGRIQPVVFAEYLKSISDYYNSCPLMIERNNHGHTVIAALEGRADLLPGLDEKPGWLTTSKSKAMMYDTLADLLKKKELTYHSEETKDQLVSIEGATLRAPEGDHDDDALSFALAIEGATMEVPKSFSWGYEK